MTSRKRKRLRWEVEHAGTPANKKKALKSALSAVKDDESRIESREAATAFGFRKKLAAWWSTVVEESQLPFTIWEDKRRARQYRIAGGCCVSLEGALAAWIFRSIRQPWWYGILAAVLTAGLLH